jgi:hypothetical protein
MLDEVADDDRFLEPGLLLETLIVMPVKAGIHIFQLVNRFPLARERREAKVLGA